MNRYKLTMAAVAVLLAAGLVRILHRDPLAQMKQAEVSVSNEPAVEALVDNALAAIEKNEMKRLYAMMLSKDAMAFDATYVKGLFAAKDFCPAKRGEVRKLERTGQVFYQVTVSSEPRRKEYVFTVVKKDGHHKISAIE